MPSNNNPAVFKGARTWPVLAHKVLVFSSYIFNPKRMKFPIPFFLIVLLLFAGSATAQDM
ncbi:uncharacterized protein METZ01_LOCUS195762, partial [marine metagenome]